MADQPNLRVVADANAKTSENQIKQQETVAEAPSSNSAPAAAVAAPGGNKVRRRRSLTRPILFALLPLALVGGGYYYVNGGQVMSTDNAYIQADMVGITTDVSGIVEQINVHENEAVKAGQVLFSLKSDSFKIALDGAKAQLGAQRNQIMNLKASYQQSLAEITQAQADLPYYQDQFDRQQSLVNNGSATQSAYDEAKHNLEAARQKVAVAKAEAATTLAQLGGSAHQPIEENPLYLQAKSNVDNAQRELDHSVVKAPFDGIVTNVNALQVGSYLQASQQAFSLVATDHLWIAASETELTYVKPGQTAEIHVDTYPGVTWKGKVESISPASGSSFSLLPAQNTTGNWVKVVQRIPMRVSIEDTEGKPPLRVGMSTVVDVETDHARGLPDFVNKLLGRSQGKDHE
ncbi:hemolysin secretion protein D [Rhizobium sp. H4]|uniref:HlyD family secretion protein n=1 Tax=Rhizobium TaxID=379 RepID=UPI000BE98A34|nr:MULTISPECIES: HlyD family secretion protein [Rhizobium]PDV86674.1 hemolysin secretion protein D [Rhizobium sp. H4]WET72800.1 HlyD family secretion protein [Rhizobium croatiense]